MSNKKILAIALCLSITAGQANAAINWDSVGSTIGKAIATFGKSALKDFKVPTWSNSKGIISLLSVSSIAVTASIFATYFYKVKAIDQDSTFAAKKHLKSDIINTGLLAGACYAASPIALNLKYLYAPLAIILGLKATGSILLAASVYLTKNTPITNALSIMALALTSPAQTLDTIKYKYKYPLHQACGFTDEKTVTKIVNNSLANTININNKDWNGRTPLDVALIYSLILEPDKKIICSESKNIIKLLAEKSANTVDTRTIKILQNTDTLSAEEKIAILDIIKDVVVEEKIYEVKHLDGNVEKFYFEKLKVSEMIEFETIFMDKDLEKAKQFIKNKQLEKILIPE